MKFSKNNFQMVSLLIAVFSLIVTIFSIIGGSELFSENNGITLYLAALIIFILFACDFLMILKRINPKQYIYISYTGQDKELALLISTNTE